MHRDAYSQIKTPALTSIRDMFDDDIHGLDARATVRTESGHERVILRSCFPVEGI